MHVLQDIFLGYSRANLTDGAHEVAHPERGLQQLLAVQIAPILLDGISISRATRCPPGPLASQGPLIFSLWLLHVLEVGGGEDFADGLHKGISYDYCDIRARVAVR
jgi:hypothetical protein